MRLLPPPLRLLAPALALLALGVPAAGLASEATTTTGSAGTTTSTSPAPAAGETPAQQTVTVTPAPGASEQEEATTTVPAPEAAPPQVQAEHSQGASPGAAAVKRKAQPKSKSTPAGEAGTEAGSSVGGVRAEQQAPGVGKLPSLTPPLPLDLSSSIAGVPSFFIESFQIPPFLLPIFQAAGTAYGVPWQVLAAINEVETDYGRDLSVSSAGAEGWMQFLPSEWAQYGVDANGDGWKDPYNPADAIFAAARYLRAAGGDTDIKAAVYSYNHSQAYVESVMLRAQLLGGTPSELLGAITGLTEARFPVYAASHYSDGFPSVSTGAGQAKTLVGTTIYSQAGAPVIAVQDGEVVQVGDSPSLGHFVALRDAYGNTYVYAQLGEVASVYPVLEPRVHTRVSKRIEGGDGSRAQAEPAPGGPATAGAQPRSPLSEGAAISGLALGAAAGLEAQPSPSAPAVPSSQATVRKPKAPARLRSFSAGQNEVYLHQLVPGVQVIQGTVLGHVGTGTAGGAASGEGAPHMLFQIRPAGLGAPLIDPKPILDGWVALEDTSIFRAKGENPFLATSPTVGQVLLESKQQLEPQVLHGSGIALGTCARQDVQEGRVAERVLAMLEYLAVSGLKPTVAGLPCASSTPAALAANAPAGGSGESVSITAVNGVPIAGHQGPGTIVDETVRKLLMLQGLSRPRRIVSLMSYPDATVAFANPSATNAIRVSFATPAGTAGHAASLFDSGLTPSEWIELVDRLGEIPDPTVPSGHSSAAIADGAGESGASTEGGAGGND
jgi:murein DD-endopeptidase MepM/ murein hydrolase activator NlpD